MWFKVDDGFYDHPKAEAAGTAALGLWARCGSYAGKHGTDGFVTEAIARRFGTAAMIGSLIKAGLWTQVPGGYQFHDWGQSNPTADEIAVARDAAAERKRRWRSQGNGHADVPSAVPRDKTRDGRVAGTRDRRVTAASGPLARRPDPTRPDPTEGQKLFANPKIDEHRKPATAAANGHVVLPPSTGSQRAAATFAWADQWEREHPGEST